MPKKIVKKVIKTKATEPDTQEQVTEALERVDPNDALAAILNEVKTLNESVVSLKKENEDLRDQLVQDPTLGGKRIVDGEAAFDVPRQKEPPPAGTYAVFRSPSPGFHQKLVRSKKIHFADGESEIIPPQFAEFEKGVCLLKDKEKIEIMRGIEHENLLSGNPVFVEIEDEEQKQAALAGKLSSRSIKSQTVTADTSLEEVVA